MDLGDRATQQLQMLLDKPVEPDEYNDVTHNRRNILYFIYDLPNSTYNR